MVKNAREVWVSDLVFGFPFDPCHDLLGGRWGPLTFPGCQKDPGRLSEAAPPGKKGGGPCG